MKSLASSGLARRLVVAKTLGLIVGIIGFFALPHVWSGVGSLTQWGILFWYATLGGIIGIIGVMDHHPMWDGFKFPWWVRGTFIGAWMNLVLVFFAYGQMSAILMEMNFMGMTSPWWFALEGAILGFLLDWAATKYGGEGKGIM